MAASGHSLSLVTDSLALQSLPKIPGYSLPRWIPNAFDLLLAEPDFSVD